MVSNWHVVNKMHSWILLQKVKKGKQLQYILQWQQWWNSKFIKDSQIWLALPANFLALWVWEGTGAIQNDKYLRWQLFWRYDNIPQNDGSIHWYILPRTNVFSQGPICEILAKIFWGLSVLKISVFLSLQFFLYFHEN